MPSASSTALGTTPRVAGVLDVNSVRVAPAVEPRDVGAKRALSGVLAEPPTKRAALLASVKVDTLDVDTATLVSALERLATVVAWSRCAPPPSPAPTEAFLAERLTGGPS